MLKKLKTEKEKLHLQLCNSYAISLIVRNKSTESINFDLINRRLPNIYFLIYIVFKLQIYLNAQLIQIQKSEKKRFHQKKHDKDYIS